MIRTNLIYYLILVSLTFSNITCTNSSEELPNGITINWSGNPRPWIGPRFWANRLQDWEVKNNRLECLISDNNRNLHILTHQLGEHEGDFFTTVDLGFINDNDALKSLGWAGFRIGAKTEFNDYRSSAVYGKGIHAGILSSGKLFIGSYGEEQANSSDEGVISSLLKDGMKLKLSAAPTTDHYLLKLALINNEGNIVEEIQKEGFKSQSLTGNIALVVDFPRRLPAEGFESTLKIKNNGANIPSFWFQNWQVGGTKVAVNEAQTLGPIIFSQFTLSKQTLKLTAQLAPVGEKDAKAVEFQTKKEGKWETIATENIDPLARVALFKITNWDDIQDTPYRLVYHWSETGENPKPHYWEGTIGKNPTEKEAIVVAGFTGNNDLGFPNVELVENVKKHQPDFLVFTGDQIYESVAGYGIQSEPLDKACLDYLRKWYLYGWEYRDLLKDIPTIALPDDHDVYHGNIWGEGGKAAQKEGSTKERQDSGGYKFNPIWVNMVQRTQTANMPDAYDPTPIKQDISVYYTDLNIGGISFGIIEDRKWKSSPANIFPPEYKVINGWPENQNYNKAKDFSAPQAELLGDRQEVFLENWVENWSEKTWMKVLLSQTIFATVATLPDSAISDVVVPTLRITKEGEYPSNDKPTQDMDSNGWPKEGRDNAVEIIRRGFAFHLAGDQHLGSTIQYGVDEWNDAGWAICVPSVSNYFPRRWFPKIPGKNRPDGAPNNLGEFEDGFGNKITVHAVSNPVFTGLEPAKLYDRAPGYGIVKFNRNSREIELANWPRHIDPTKADAKPYDGWPITINQEDNYGRKAKAYLPTVEVSGLENPPVIQIIDEASSEIVYTIRAKENNFSPKVFRQGNYTIKVGADTENMQSFTNIKSLAKAGQDKLSVKF